LAKVTDGKSSTFGKSKKKKTNPWFSAKAPGPSSPSPSPSGRIHSTPPPPPSRQARLGKPISSVTVTPDTKNKSSKRKKYLKDFEIWVGETAGDNRQGGEVRRTVCLVSHQKGANHDVVRRCQVQARVCRPARRIAITREPSELSLYSPSLRTRHRYVTVILPGTRNTLAFGEIEVH